MRLRKVRLRNFRCYKDETSFDISDLTVFAGRNDVGKSTVFDALNIFFEEGKIDADDACTLKAIFEYIEVFYMRDHRGVFLSRYRLYPSPS